jgi:hypothetical protein
MIYILSFRIVDAFFVQTATSTTKSITLWFGLVGLYLYVEKGYTGRKVQQMHGVLLFGRHLRRIGKL